MLPSRLHKRDKQQQTRKCSWFNVIFHSLVLYNTCSPSEVCSSQNQLTFIPSQIRLESVSWSVISAGLTLTSNNSALNYCHHLVGGLGFISWDKMKGVKRFRVLHSRTNFFGLYFGRFFLNWNREISIMIINIYIIAKSTCVFLYFFFNAIKCAMERQTV